MSRLTKKEERIGETLTMRDGTTATIIDYKDANHVTVVIKESGEQIVTQYHTFKKGGVKSHFTPTIFGVGIVGVYEHYNSPAYRHWYNIMTRCYDERYHKKYPTYIGCTICDEWKYFPNFEKWFNENYYTIEGEDKPMCLDKDIIHKHNKTYSPENCVFVPNRINVLFTKNNARRGKYPIGVTKSGNKYRAKVSKFYNNKKQIIGLGYYDTPVDAFEAYKKEKEEYIKEVAEEYKDVIPTKLYNAMYNYEVEITD